MHFKKKQIKNLSCTETKKQNKQNQLLFQIHFKIIRKNE